MAIIDVPTPYTLYWSLNNTTTANWCADTLQGALVKSWKPQIMNTNQSSQLTSKAVDNIFIEQFWHNVKYEQVYRNVLQKATGLYQDLEKYMVFNSNYRLHQSLDYNMP